jgi:hypothetical protein
MRLPRVRFTVRRMMVAMAVVGVAIWGIVQTNRWRERTRYYTARADFLDLQARWDLFRESQSRSMAAKFWETGKRGRFDERTIAILRDRRRTIGDRFDYIARIERNAASYDESAVFSKRLADYHSSLSKKYRRAARYPWLRVAPDPPEPE